MSSPIDNYRNYLARNYSDMKLPAGKPYGVIKLAKGYDLGFHVRKDHISVNFISNGTHDPEEVMGYINDNGIGDKTYGDGLEPDVFRGKRNAAVVRCEVHIPLESVDELRKPTLRKHSQQIFGELYDDFSGIADVEMPKPKEDTAETVEEVAEAPVEEKSDKEQAKDEAMKKKANHDYYYIEDLKMGVEYWCLKSDSSENPISGKCRYYAPDGKEFSETTIQNGEIYDGVVTHWHDNGKKSFESIFRDGKYVKSTEWDESGEESGEVAETSESVGISNFTDKKVEFVEGDVWQATYLIDGVEEEVWFTDGVNFDNYYDPDFPALVLELTYKLEKYGIVMMVSAGFSKNEYGDFICDSCDLADPIVEDIED